jgi:hypothetical protein
MLATTSRGNFASGAAEGETHVSGIQRTMAVVEKQGEVAPVATESEPAQVGNFCWDNGLPALAGLALVQEVAR